MNRMQFTCTAWVESLKNPKEWQGKHTVSAKNMLLYYCMTFFPTGRYLLGLKFTTTLKPNISTTLNTWKKKLDYLACTKHDRISRKCIFKSNIIYSSQKKRALFLQAWTSVKVNCIFYIHYMFSVKSGETFT